MDLFKAMRVVVKVADEGSLAAAARTLDLAPAVVTRLVADLEQHLGTRLMHRSTRRLTLTEAGDQYLASRRSTGSGMSAMYAHVLSRSLPRKPRLPSGTPFQRRMA